MAPIKIVEYVKETAQRGRWAGAEVEVRRISWELNGKRYRTRKEAVDASTTE